MRTLAGKRVLITGGGGGIGRALSLAFARAESEVLVTDRDEPAARETAGLCRRLAGRGQAYGTDVTDPAEILALRRRVHAEGGVVDVVINNAGVVFGGPFLDVPLDRHQMTERVNLAGVIAITHAFLPDLLLQSEGHLVNVASASAFIGLPFGSTYAATKWGVVGFTESLRLELAALGHRGVGMTAVCPSYVATGLFDGVRPPLTTRLLTPERVADLTLDAVRRNRPLVLTPWLVRMTPPLKGVLPRRLFDWVATALGVNASMRRWHGRG